MADARAPHRVRGRGASDNPQNRFVLRGEESLLPVPERVETRYLPDASRSIIARNDSPDVPFDASFNPYRGCEHGCIYCYARPTHEYLGYSAGLDFETRILVKEKAPSLLRAALGAPSWKPQVLGLSGVTDPYQPVERRLRLTRACLEVLAEYRNPVAVVTKNALVCRDTDLLGELAGHRAASVYLSLTTLDGSLVRALEPRTSHPRRRLEAISSLARAGIPVGVLVAPVIPGINDHEIPSLLQAAAAAGAQAAGYVLLRLPGAVAGLFENWLEAHLPDRKKKVLERLRCLRSGRLNDPRFMERMRGTGVFADQIRSLFELHRKRCGLEKRSGKLSTEAFRRPRRESPQMSLF